jgi:hypothetical protein
MRAVVNPQSVVKRWQRETQRAHGNSKCTQDLKRDAVAARKRFVCCLENLPADQAAPLWQAAQAVVSAHIASLV